MTVTGTNLTNADAAHSISLQGPGAVGAAGQGYALTYGNGYSWINRLTLYGANSAVIEQQNYCNDNMNLMLVHNSNASYLQGDAQQLIGVGAPFGYAASATSAQIDLVLPLPLSAFNSSTQDFPAYLLSSPLTLQIDVASVARALYNGATATITDYSVSNTYLIYQAVELPSAFIEAERMAVKSSPFIMNLTSTLSVQVPASILTSYSLGINASSVRACFVLPSNQASYSSGTQLQYVRDTSDYNSTPAFNGSGTNAIVFVDGNQINSAIFDTPAMVFQGLKSALHHNLQGSVIYSSPSLVSASLAANPWLTQFHAIGWDLTSLTSSGEEQQPVMVC